MIYYTKASRVLRGLMYSCFILAGAVALVEPTNIIQAELGLANIAWALFLAVGGVLSLFGVFSGYWFGEMTGLPLVISSIGVFGGAVLVNADGSASRVSVGLLAVAVTWGLTDRWRDIYVMSKVSKKATE